MSFWYISRKEKYLLKRAFVSIFVVVVVVVLLLCSKMLIFVTFYINQKHKRYQAERRLFKTNCERWSNPSIKLLKSIWKILKSSWSFLLFRLWFRAWIKMLKGCFVVSTVGKNMLPVPNINFRLLILINICWNTTDTEIFI